MEGTKKHRPYNKCARFQLDYCKFLRLLNISKTGDISHVGFRGNMLIYHCAITLSAVFLQCVEVVVNARTSTVPVHLFVKNWFIILQLFKIHFKGFD